MGANNCQKQTIITTREVLWSGHLVDKNSLLTSQHQSQVSATNHLSKSSKCGQNKFLINNNISTKTRVISFTISVSEYGPFSSLSASNLPLTKVLNIEEYFDRVLSVVWNAIPPTFNFTGPFWSSRISVRSLSSFHTLSFLWKAVFRINNCMLRAWKVLRALPFRSKMFFVL